MMFCLDADICIEAVRRNFPAIADRIRRCPPEQLCVAALAKAEVLLGLETGHKPHREEQPLRTLFGFLRVLPFDERAAEHYVTLRAHLQRKGQLIGANDMIIAATALAHDAVLVTRNARDFSRVASLSFQDWSQP